MLLKARQIISSSILNILLKHNITRSNVFTALELHRGKPKTNELELHLPIQQLKKNLHFTSQDAEMKSSPTNLIADILKMQIDNNTNNDDDNIVNGMVDSVEPIAPLITKIDFNNSKPSKIIFTLNVDNIYKNILCENKQNIHEIFKNKYFNRITNTGDDHEQSKIIIEFSSVNIAKPFHMGHLRSTIIGNFISNLYKSLNENCIRMNYLGDWGTQFGYLNIGIDLLNISDDAMKSDPITQLFNAYVHANKCGETDETIGNRAREIFYQLEYGKMNEIEKNWQNYRKYTINELEMVYKRLGVTFDIYNWESDYNRNAIEPILNELIIKKLLLKDDDGRQYINVNQKPITIVKSDGTTLYLTRDIAALIDRYNKYKFKKMLYIVDSSQQDHFNALFDIGHQLKLPFIDNVEHIKFGRIKKMSTRKGNVIFLKDILNEARDIMLQKQIQSSTTKVDIDKIGDQAADILGVSAVIVNDLKHNRMKDYDFDWNNVLQTNGDTGIKLQYTHCRLCSLIENLGIEPAEICDVNILKENEALTLIYEIARFPEIILRTEESLESSILVNYLFSLCNAVSRALKLLNIKNNADINVQRQRILLFTAAKKVLYQGMTILGLQPLEKM